MKPEPRDTAVVGDFLLSDLDLQLLLAHVLGVERAWLYAHSDEPLAASQIGELKRLASRLTAGEPLAYILGKRDFWKSSLVVDASVLVPRPETELLVEITLSLVRQASATVLDIGTGSGAIAIALKTERPTWHVLASDICSATLATATKNVSPHDIPLLRGNWLDSFAAGSVDCIVSNPPYVRADDPHLATLQYEPRDALVAGADGLDAIHAVLADASRVLADNGWLILEHGYDQQQEVLALFLEAGFTTVTGRADMNSVPRAVYGKRG